MSSAWREALVQEQVSAALRDQLGLHCSAAAIAKLANRATDKASVAALVAAAKAITNKLPPDLVAALREEVAAIEADAKWIGTKRGRYLLAINQWAEGFHRELRTRPEFADAYLGGHVDKQVVVVTGTVRSQQVLDDLLAYVASKAPPYRLLVKVAIAP